MNNLTWSKLIIQQLTSQGIHHFCIAPGSRSTPLAIALGEKKNAFYTTHFDERGLGFYALGLAKASCHPVAIIVTSGTAVGNLMPSVMEAWYDHVPLLLLTADRPPELRDCGANQTTDQVKIFSSFVRYEVDLPCPFPGGERYLAGTIGYGVHKALSQKGPVHFNCMFREPLFVHSNFEESVPPVRYYQDPPQISIPTLKTIAEELHQHEKGVIICGHNRRGNGSSIHALAERLEWPLFADIGSNLRGDHSPASIAHYDFLLKNSSDLKPTAILHCGGRLVGRILLEWCERARVKLYIHIDDNPSRLDPQHIVTHRFEVDAIGLCTMLLPYLSESPSSLWLKEWQMQASPIAETLPALFPQSCNEPGLMHALKRYVGKEQALFFANSMPIRDAHLFFFPSQKIGPIFTNRGLSGIDGNIATVAGIANGLQQPVIAVLGDLASLHDLNSLSFLKKTEVPVLLIVINNAGGAIFSFLPHLANTSHFNELFAHDHHFDFCQAAALFSLPYQIPSSMNEFDATLREFCRNPSTCLLEFHTERQSNFQLHQHIESEIRSLLLPVCVR